MASNSDNGRKHASRPPRKPVTLDLEATDVTPETAAETPSEDTEASVDAAGESTAPEMAAATPDDAAEPRTERDAGADAMIEPNDEAGPEEEAPATSQAEEPAAPSASETDHAPATPPFQAAAPAERKKSGIVGWFAAALAGGAVALGGGYGLQQAGVLPGPATQNVADAQSALEEARARIGALEQKITALAEGATAQNETAGAVSALDARIKALESAPAGTAGTDTAALTTRLDTIEAATKAAAEKAESAATTAGDAATAKAVETLANDITEMRKLVSTGAAGSDVALESLQSELATLREALAATRAELTAIAEKPAGDPAIGDKIARLETRIAEIEKAGATATQKLNEVATAAAQAAGGGALAETVAALSSRLEAADTARAETATTANALKTTTETLTTDLATASQKLDGLTRTVEAAAAKTGEIATTVAALGERVGQIEKDVGGIPARETAARAVAIASLSDAVEAGRPYATELAAVAKMVGGDTDLTLLTSHAEAGIPTRAALIEQFSEVGATMLASAETPTEESGFVDKLWNNARSAIRVRPVGDASGSDVAAIVARMEVAVGKGDFAAALSEYDTLPETAKAAGAAWAETVRVRLDADTLMRKVSADVLAVLAGPGN